MNTDFNCAYLSISVVPDWHVVVPTLTLTAFMSQFRGIVWNHINIR